jgi:hypothetical protein
MRVPGKTARVHSGFLADIALPEGNKNTARREPGKDSDVAASVLQHLAVQRHYTASDTGLVGTIRRLFSGK